MKTDLLAKLFLVIFSVFLVLIFYKGIITPPSEGDSVDYHIPIAKSILNGQVFSPSKIPSPSHTRYYPANAEVILSTFVLSKIPLGLFNVVGIIVLLFACLKLARSFKLGRDMSIIFAVSASTLNGIIRWADTQIIDIWMLSFFLFALSYLENPKNDYKYFLKTGFFIGLFIGSKFSAPFIAFILFVVYFNKINKFFTKEKLLLFSIPIIILGFGWYIRNYSLTGNPFYPQAFLFFPGLKNTILGVTVLDILTGPLKGVLGTINAFVSEYIAWAFLMPITIIVYFTKFKRNKKLDNIPLRLLILSFLIIAVNLKLPSATVEHIMTSSMRYFLTGFIPLMLFVFIYWSKLKKETELILLSLVSILLVGFPIGYFPKVSLLAVPVALLMYYKGYNFIVSLIKKI